MSQEDEGCAFRCRINCLIAEGALGVGDKEAGGEASTKANDGG